MHHTCSTRVCAYTSSCQLVRSQSPEFWKIFLKVHGCSIDFVQTVINNNRFELPESQLKNDYSFICTDTTVHCRCHHLLCAVIQAEIEWSRQLTSVSRSLARHACASTTPPSLRITRASRTTGCLWLTPMDRSEEKRLTVTIIWVLEILGLRL